MLMSILELLSVCDLCSLGKKALDKPLVEVATICFLRSTYTETQNMHKVQKVNLLFNVFLAEVGIALRSSFHNIADRKAHRWVIFKDYFSEFMNRQTVHNKKSSSNIYVNVVNITTPSEVACF